METTKKNEALSEGSTLAEKWINDTNEVMLDIYSKQLNFTTGLYNNFFNSLSGNNKSWGDGRMLTDNLLNNNLTKGFSEPFTGFGNIFLNSFFPSFSKIFKQLAEYDRHFLSTFSGGIKNNGIQWAEINKGYKEAIESQLETTRKMFSSLTEAYTKQLRLSIETTKKVTEKLNEQFKDIQKQSQALWADMLKFNQTLIANEEIKSKESADKKRSSDLIVA